MSSREPFEMVEIDVERCSLTFGTAPCTAALGGRTLRKCYQTKRTCGDRPNFTLGAPLTLRFAKPGRLPKGVQVFPALEGVRAQTGTVNIAGSDPRMGALGKRGMLAFDLRDFAWHDRDFDRYQSERITGAAQIDELGYDPATRGTQLAKIKARWPNYSGAAVRYIVGYIDGGQIVDAQTRHYVLTAFDGPDDQGRYSCEAMDILDLVSEKRALAPRPSNGVLAADITSTATTATLTPAGIGDAEYPASGRVVIGSEMCEFTRSGDTLALTGRGVRGTSAAAHNAGDPVQVVLTYVAARIDAVMVNLIANFTQTPLAFLPIGEWEAEIDRWAPSLLLTTDITTPTPVGQLLGELVDLGVSIWWDDIAQKIGLKVNRPLDTDTLFRFTDRNIKTLRAEDRDEDRLTQVLFFTKRANPTRNLTDEANYDRVIQTVDPDATEFYGETRVRKVFTRWLDGGGDTIAALTSLRLLDRFRDAPVRYKVTVDARDRAVALTDVVELRSDLTQGVAGAPTARLVQVISRSEPVPGHEVMIEAQAFQFDGRFGFIAPDDAPQYDAATDAQKAEFAFASDGNNLFPDGQPPYQII